jgi:hypothetical protein
MYGQRLQGWWAGKTEFTAADEPFPSCALPYIMPIKWMVQRQSVQHSKSQRIINHAYLLCHTFCNSSFGDIPCEGSTSHAWFVLLFLTMSLNILTKWAK